MRHIFIKGVFVFLLLCPSFLYTGQVRTIHTNDKAIKTIHLSMGQSTILRFAEKPKKVVLGNANYVHIEFINNDLAIQPLESVTTNLFVYADFGRTYGFKLKVGNSPHYDDLVNVRWRAKGKIKLAKKKTFKRKKKLKQRKLTKKPQFRFDKFLMTVESVSKHNVLNLYFVDLKIKNVSDSSLSLKPVKIKLIRKNKPLFGQVVIDSYSLKQGEVTKARIILRLEKKSPFTLKADFRQESKTVLISKKHL